MLSSSIIKLTNICNLNCSYCYMFKLGDKTFSKVPKFMSIETMILFLDKLEIYLTKKASREFKIVLHGGEPTLWPIKYFKIFFQRIRKLRKTFNIEVSIQTNAFQVNYELLEILHDNHVSIGISIDGPKEVNDLYRVDHRGKGSYNKVMDNVNSIIDKGYKDIIGGFLVVVDPMSDIDDFMCWLLELPIRKVDLLWPIEYNYNYTPWDKFKKSEIEYLLDPIYGKWFAKMFERWMEIDDPEFKIRHFYEVIYLLLGSKTHTDSLVNDQINMFVLNSDGNIEYHDYFRAFSDGRTRSKYFIKDHQILDFERSEFMSKLLKLENSLPTECIKCIHKEICGGGFLPGRMDKNSNSIRLNRKSVLCYDQWYFINYVKGILSKKFDRQLTVS